MDVEKTTRKNRKNRPYTFLPYDSEEEFQKAESSTFSRNSKRTAAGIYDTKQRELSEYHQNSRQFLATPETARNQISKPKPSKKSLYPLGGPSLWNTQCNLCDEEIQKFGKKLDNKKLFSNDIDNIYMIAGDGSSNQYVLEYADSRLQKHSTQTLIRQHLQEFINFLQKAAFQSTSKSK